MGRHILQQNISLAPGFGVFFLYALWVWLCDGVDLVCYLTGLAQCTVLSRALVTAMLAGGVYALRERVCLRRERKDGLYYVLAAVILLFAVHKGIIVDYSMDTNKYHILVQNPGFVSATTENLMPGDFQMFGFRWADRMFYAFRALLGYRMGTIFTGLTAVLMFTQVRSLLTTLFGDRLARCRAVLPRGLGWVFGESLLAFCVTTVSELVIQQGTYMVDSVSIPFALEALYLLLTAWDKKQNGLQMVWFALLNGCYFACKMTHVVYVAPMILLYLFLHRKQVTVQRFAAAFVIAFAPVCVYLIYNVADTGNPIFPYFNHILQSPYFWEDGFKDTRWGPSDLKELILWPIYSCTQPYYRLSEVPNQFPLGTTMYLVVTGLGALTLLLRNKEERPVTGLLLALVLSTFYFWAATTGHSRYYMLGYILTGVLVVDVLSAAFVRRNLLLRLGALGAMVILLVQPWVLMESVSGGFEYAWRDSWNAEQVKANLPYVMRDQDGTVQDDFIPAPDLLLTSFDAFGSICNVLYPEVPIVQKVYLNTAVSDEVRARWAPYVQEALETGVVYEPLFGKNSNVNWKNYVNKLAGYGLTVETIYWPDTIFSADDDILLVQLGLLPEGETNTLLYANAAEDVLTVDPGIVTLQALVTMTQWNAIGEAVTVSVIADDGQLLYTAELLPGETLHLNAQLDLTAYDASVTLRFTCTEGDGETSWQPQCLVLNPHCS